MKLMVLLFSLTAFYSRVDCQANSFSFYGTEVKIYQSTNYEDNALLKDNKVASNLMVWMDSCIHEFGLKDWGIVLFVDHYINAKFRSSRQYEREKIRLTLLTHFEINNAIGIKNSKSILSLVSISNQAKPHGVPLGNEIGHQLIYAAPSKEPFNIKEEKMNYWKGYDIKLKAPSPKLKVVDTVMRQLTFQNFITKKRDTITFFYSPQHLLFSNDFPFSLNRTHYDSVPVSELFRQTLVDDLSEKLSGCYSLVDSINFLMRFTQTVLRYEIRPMLFSPEKSLVIGTGDCADYCFLFAFLASYFFQDIALVYLMYDNLNHVRVGVSSPRLNVDEMAYIEYNNQKFALVELIGQTVLGDQLFRGGSKPSRVVN